MEPVLWQSDLPGLPPPRRGKVRDVYDLGEVLLIVASDRLSAYDHVLQPGIPGKGKILNQLSKEDRWRDMTNLIDDELLHTVAVVGEPTNVIAELKKRYGDLVDRVALSTAYGLDENVLDAIADGLRIG